jgi:hypothetical protein
MISPAANISQSTVSSKTGAVTTLKSSTSTAAAAAASHTTVSKRDKAPTGTATHNTAITATAITTTSGGGVDLSREEPLARLNISNADGHNLTSDSGAYLKTGMHDPLIMRQKWLREWLHRTQDKGYMYLSLAPKISATAKANEALRMKEAAATAAAHNSSYSKLSVMPASLRLLPQRKDFSDSASSNHYKGSSSNANSTSSSSKVLEGSILVRNFSSNPIEIGVATSSKDITVKSDRITIAGHDAIRYNSLHNLNIYYIFKFNNYALFVLKCCCLLSK